MTVDIMLPYYGDVGLMQDAVRSVLAQNHGDWRLTVVDDGSPDDSVAAWLDSLNDERVRYFRNQERLGAQPNHRHCLSYVEHDLFVIMGADDMMLPNYLDVVLRLHEVAPEAAIIQPGVQIIDQRGAEIRTLVDTVKKWCVPPGSGRRVLGGESLATSLLRGNWLYNPSLCWQRSALDMVSLRDDVNVFDLALPLDVIAAGGKLVIDDTLCFKYRRHRSSSWSKANTGIRFPKERRFFLEVAQDMDSLGWHRAARAARMHISSRLHAAVQLPVAARRRDPSAVRNLSQHIFSRSRESRGNWPASAR